MQNTTGKEKTVQIIPSVQEVSKPAFGRLSPTHLSYWQSRVFQATYTRNGVRQTTANFTCKIQFAGRRESFPLHTANRDDAAQNARDIYVSIVRTGWDATLKIYKPKPIVAPTVLTVAEFFRLVVMTGLITEVTLNTYKTKLRSLIAFICGLGSGRAKGVRHREWRRKVDSQPLSVLTLDALKNFKRHILSRAAQDSAKLRQASITYDSYIRNLRSLFREAVLKEIAQLGVEIPHQMFDQMPFMIKGRSAFAYVSTIQAKALMKAAKDELLEKEPYAYLIFALGLLLGLRRGEIDGIRWDMVNWERRIIALVPHQFLRLKTPGSSAPIEMEPKVVQLLRRYQKIATSEYVVHSENAPRNATHYRHYRCERHFNILNNWLSEKGVSALKPLHTLRKECGSLVNSRFGLVAAKNKLRHATIDMTVTYYIDNKGTGNTGLASLLPDDRKDWL